MTVAVLRRTNGYALEINGTTTHLNDEQIHDLAAALAALRRDSGTKAVSPAQARWAPREQ